jgi:hypothetical protein
MIKLKQNPTTPNITNKSGMYEEFDLLFNDDSKQMKRTLIIYNTEKTTEEEAKHLLEILNCDDSTLWDNADHCGVQVIEVPINNETYGGKK